MMQAHWISLYKRALQAAPAALPSACQLAESEMRIRIVEISVRTSEDDRPEYAALQLGLADLNVLMSAQWKQLKRDEDDRWHRGLEARRARNKICAKS